MGDCLAREKETLKNTEIADTVKKNTEITDTVKTSLLELRWSTEQEATPTQG